eukprot:CAMPEP_0196663794 /NCGR_PEP_ID=MMETSP1086-20130531/54293_1 /TAXON_ID=77921 /ORGANISM="Cyanoptyche  gloeocystis , Strain SAG4.97" /LENGTH=301 /DNA_ID=CAMNT_0041999757 /DNA_START=223 /DNA_END=1124 /DNA_ORIENTATION=-
MTLGESSKQGTTASAAAAAEGPVRAVDSSASSDLGKLSEAATDSQSSNGFSFIFNGDFSEGQYESKDSSAFPRVSASPKAPKTAQARPAISSGSNLERAEPFVKVNKVTEPELTVPVSSYQGADQRHVALPLQPAKPHLVLQSSGARSQKPYSAAKSIRSVKEKTKRCGARQRSLCRHRTFSEVWGSGTDSVEQGLHVEVKYVCLSSQSMACADDLVQILYSPWSGTSFRPWVGRVVEVWDSCRTSCLKVQHARVRLLRQIGPAAVDAQGPTADDIFPMSVGDVAAESESESFLNARVQWV